MISQNLGLSHSQMGQQQSRHNYNRRAYITYPRGIPRTPAKVIRKTVLLTPIRHLLHKKSYQHKETQQIYLIHTDKYEKAGKMGKQRKHVPNQRTGEIPRKRTK